MWTPASSNFLPQLWSAEEDLTQQATRLANAKKNWLKQKSIPAWQKRQNFRFDIEPTVLNHLQNKHYYTCITHKSQHIGRFLWQTSTPSAHFDIAGLSHDLPQQIPIILFPKGFLLLNDHDVIFLFDKEYLEVSLKLLPSQLQNTFYILDKTRNCYAWQLPPVLSHALKKKRCLPPHKQIPKHNYPADDQGLAISPWILSSPISINVCILGIYS